MPSDFLPTSEAEYDNFAFNFDAGLAEIAAEVGVTPAEVAAFAAAKADYSTAKAQRNAVKTQYEGLVTATTGARATLTAQIRALTAKIQQSPNVSDSIRRRLDITVPKTTRSVVQAPATTPVLRAAVSGPHRHTLSFSDSDTPQSKAKPQGVSGCQLFVLVLPIGSPTPVEPADFHFVATLSRTPYSLNHDVAHIGQTAHYIARWQNEKGEPGPWGLVISLTIAA